MKAIQVHKYVEDASSFPDMKEEEADAYLSMNENVINPTSLKKNQILVQVFACSVDPGCLMVAIHGHMILMREKCPFTPGMDICGKVVNHNGSNAFQNGDIVVASNGVAPVGGLAELMVVQEEQAALKPTNVSVLQAASCSSAITARNAVMDHVKKGDRVLVLGGSGGVGSAAIQIAKKQAGAIFVATTSTQSKMCKKLGSDQVIDYRNQDWWLIPEFQQEKFDVVIDTVGGGNYYGRADQVLKTGKQGGTFVAVTGDDPKPKLVSMWKLFKFFTKIIGRSIYTMFNTRTLPKYVTLFPYGEAQGRKEVLGWMQEGTLDIKLDEDSPMPFTAKGVRQAFAKVGSGHAHGKVVIRIAEE